MDRLTAMETYVCVVETESFSGAARLLNVGQPAVSKAIAQLEERLGIRLLLRSTRGLTPTDAGTAFYECAKRAIGEVEQAELVARRAATNLAGRVRVSASVTFGRLHINPVIGRFLDQHPHLSLDIILDDRNVDLLEEGIDIALRMGTLDVSNLTARKLGEAPRLVVGTPAYFERAGVPATPADLASHEFITYSQPRGGGTWTFRRDSSEVSVSLSGRLSISAAEGVREAVLANLGVAVASEWMFAPELKSGRIRPVLTDWRLPPIELWAVTPEGRMVSAKTRAFISFVEETLGLTRCTDAA
ncbi:LysR family transcriptional regulator [Trinickia mobilis]|uniref:LysR family transcriptional regulator n=1 Tax=Trinickia mobilis TaxID=2816356 RepID=UPI001A9046B6|nr:LysR family transcriptional regulator [Trinickia mobilis]